VSQQPVNQDGSLERDQADMARLAAGHGAALNGLMERHAGKLLLYLVRSLQDEEDAADLVQETFVRVFQNRTRFNPKQRFSTWLYTIATNLVKDRYRFRTRHPKVSLEAQNERGGADFRESLPEQGPTPSELMQKSEQAEAVRKAVAELPEDLRVPLILSDYEDLSHNEIGAILDCTSKAVETRLYRARKQLREKLGYLLLP
jgi:RNA polymerase sigma-70 factor, ECF subfamily